MVLVVCEEHKMLSSRGKILKCSLIPYFSSKLSSFCWLFSVYIYTAVIVTKGKVTNTPVSFQGCTQWNS